MSRLDRRALFTSGAAAALLSAAGMSAQAAPRRGGTLRIAVERRATCPGRMGAIYETLTEIGPDGVLRPMLATEWHSDDARHWRLTLRDDAQFHDGAALTEEAVAAALSGALPGLVPTGKGELSLGLEEADPNLPWRLADPALSIRSDTGAGTGLYRLRDERAGGHFTVDRMAEHYRDGQAGWADRVEVVVISDPSVRAEALRDGHVDVVELPARDALPGRYLYHPSEAEAALVAHQGVAIPARVSAQGALDGGRIAERWGLL